MRKAWIRVDANKTIGRGHLSRCMALAEILKCEFQIIFLIKKENQMFTQTILEKWQTHYIKDDAEMTSLLGANDMLIVDSYVIDNRWRSYYKQFVSTLVDINDIPGEIRGANIILNHCPGISKDQYVTDDETVFLLGLNFAILRKQFLEYASSNSYKLEEKGVFICFGGADTYQLGSKFVNALLLSKFEEPIYWVTNDSSIFTNEIVNSNITTLSNLSEIEMIYYMSIAKVLLIPSSVLSFEGIAIRKPIFTCYFVDNQKLIHQGLIKDGLAEGVGYIETTADVDRALNPFFKFYDNTEIHKKHIKNQSKLLDGNSGDRIKKILFQVN